jgi:hypothetical protein
MVLLLLHCHDGQYGASDKKKDHAWIFHKYQYYALVTHLYYVMELLLCDYQMEHNT